MTSETPYPTQIRVGNTQAADSRRTQETLDEIQATVESMKANAPKPAEPAIWDSTTICFGSDCPNCEREKREAKSAEPPACRICGKAPAWNGGDWCRDCSRGKGEPQSEPRIEHRDVCHASYPCEDCGKVRSRAEGGTTFTVCDDCWDKRQSEPPIDRFEAMHAAWKAEQAISIALRAERDALKAEVEEKHTMLLNSAGHVNRLDRENADLKARVEELEVMAMEFANSIVRGIIAVGKAVRARKEQENTNAR